MPSADGCLVKPLAEYGLTRGGDHAEEDAPVAQGASALLQLSPLDEPKQRETIQFRIELHSEKPKMPLTTHQLLSPQVKYRE